MLSPSVKWESKQEREREGWWDGEGEGGGQGEKKGISFYSHNFIYKLYWIC